MPERRTKLLALLAELRAELARSEDLDPTRQREIERTLSRVESTLHDEDALDAKESPFHTPLEKAMAAVEQTHPALYKVAMNFINALSEMGI